MDKEQRERLEQELRFLKESLEADVISKDEFERGKERIERKLKEFEEKEKTIGEEQKEAKIEEEPETKPEEPKEKEEFKEIEEEIGEKTHLKEEIEIKEIKPKPTKIIGAEKEEEQEELTKEKPEEIEQEEEFKISKKWIYWALILIIAVVLFFSIRSCYKEIPMEENEQIEEFMPVCSSNSDCKQEGSVGACLNPGTKEAECEFKEDVSTQLLVINDKDCELCDSSRMKDIIKEVFPNVKISEIDQNAEEAKNLINSTNIDALPAYIFDSDVSKAINFNNFERALIKKGDNYLITNTASGAIFYFKRKKIDNQLDIFSTKEAEETVDKNLNEFLNLFKDNINFNKHMVSEKEKTDLKKELGITSYPAFLVNNQFKFGGIQSAESIKEKFCQLNKLDECKKELSKDVK